ncbi:COP9 signalosome complex subunit 1 [Halotydeus destructor]|nr:COP9 signalosome complex subunit 1 [Halotydeus destructor]
MPLPIQVFSNNSIEPMQLDAADDNDSGDEMAVASSEPLGSYLVENATLDLEAYANSYSGLAKIDRLVFVANHSPLALRIEAYKMALSYVKENTYNVSMYNALYQKLSDAYKQSGQSVDSNIGPLDTPWMEEKSKKANLKLEKLDTDLKNYKSNSIKESIRRGHDDLGDHYLEMGDLGNALKCYSRSRDYCTSSKHVLNMCLNVIKVSIQLQNWSHVLTYVAKAQATPDFPPTGVIATKLQCAAGLADLASRKYKSSAKNFLNCNFDHFANDAGEIISPNNVAIYGGLCALATYDRSELHKNVIASSSFKLFLELEPQLRDAITRFYNSQYARCLSILDEIRDNLLLDIYLAPHVATLYNHIRNRALVQYFSPYISADMKKMASAFNTSVTALEDELMQLILEGQIQARIDSHNKVLYAKDVDLRTVTFERAMEMGDAWQKRTKALILRSAMLKHGSIQVKSPPTQREESTPSGSTMANALTSK